MFIPRQMVTDRPLCGRSTGWHCAVYSRLHKPVRADPSEPDSPGEPPVTHTSLGRQVEKLTGAHEETPKQKLEESFGSGSFHRSDSEFVQQTAPSSVTPSCVLSPSGSQLKKRRIRTNPESAYGGLRKILKQP